MKKKVLIIAGYYLPAVKGGGPIQSIKNLVDNLGDEIDFYIIAADRDLGENKPFSNIVIDEWVEVGKAKVFYTNMKQLSARKVRLLILNLDCDILYLNSFFSFRSSILLILLFKTNLIRNTKIIIAPRGQFSQGALGLKSWKKNKYIQISKIFSLYKNIDWHATNINEKEEIESIFGNNIKISIASNLTKNHRDIAFTKNIEKFVGSIKLVYIARIHPMKNLYQILEILQNFDEKIEFNIYGPIEDENYWEKCKNIIGNLSENINVNYLGTADNSKVYSIYKNHHVAILLTLGENFGHSIAEALIGGCPVIISDKTPWTKLREKNVGYDLALDDEKSIIDAIRHYIELDQYMYEKSSLSAFKYAKKSLNTEDDINKYLTIFNKSM